MTRFKYAIERVLNRRSVFLLPTFTLCGMHHVPQRGFPYLGNIDAGVFGIYIVVDWKRDICRLAGRSG